MASIHIKDMSASYNRGKSYVLDKLKLTFDDLVTVINTAVSLITGEDSEQGEQ